MAAMHASREVRRLVMTALGAALVASALASCRDSGSEVAIDPTADGWKTVEYQGVQVDVPAGWTHADMTSCEFQFERWIPPDLPACSPDGGVSFYRSATFDPAFGPGVRHEKPDQDPSTGTDTGSDTPDWAGYVYAGDFAVYAADDDPDLVRHVLTSARASGG